MSLYFRTCWGAVGYALVRTEPLFFASGMMTAIGGLGSATVQAALTKHVPPSRTGQILGAVGMLNALSRVIGPVIFNGLWAITVGSYPQASFIMMASLFGLALLCSFAVKPHGKYLLKLKRNQRVWMLTEECSILGRGP